MAEYKISGVWKDTQNVITHYALHTVAMNGLTRAAKTSKVQAIQLLEANNSTAFTWVWNYKMAKWDEGEKVEVVNSAHGKFLRTNPDNKLTDNLAHLIDFDWIAP